MTSGKCLFFLSPLLLSDPNHIWFQFNCQISIVYRVWSITYDLERKEFILFRFNSELESASLTFAFQSVVPCPVFSEIRSPY